MQLNRESNPAQFQITKYSANSVTVNDQEFTHSIIVMPDQVLPWQVASLANLTSADLLTLAALNPEIILLGTGPELAFPSPVITQALFASHIGLEVMTTPAACRTYAALTSEGRNVLAALILGA